MADLGAIHEDVRFDWSAAEGLAAELRATASILDGQIGHRNAIAGQARQEWRGVFADQFADRMRVCAADAHRLSEAMRRAARQLDELRRLAREEQTRRERAREWERQEKNEGVVEKVVEFFTGEDDKPPVPGPVEPPAYVTLDPTARSRG